jgi:hypothetical protein
MNCEAGEVQHKLYVLQALAAGLLADHNVGSSVPYPLDHYVPTERTILVLPEGLSGQGYLKENFISFGLEHYIIWWT